MIKRQHYIPKKVLEIFLDEDKELFEILVEPKRIYPTKPVNAMCESYVYEHKDLEVNAIENAFSKLESNFVIDLEKLVDEVKSLSSNKIESIESIKNKVFDLLPLLLIFYYRSNALLEEYSMGNKDFKIPLLLKKIQNMPYILKLAALIKNNYEIALLSTDKSFLLSDQYLSTAALKIKGRFPSFSNRNIGLIDTLLLIPLTRKYYIALWNSNRKNPFKVGCFQVLDNKETFLVNRVIINNSYKKCVGARMLLEQMKDEWFHRSPTQIFIGHKDKSSSGFVRKKEVFYFKRDETVYRTMTDEFMKLKNYEQAQKNDSCPCGSGALFKNCHKRIIREINNIYSKSDAQEKLVVDGGVFFEQPIDSWGPLSRIWPG